MSVEAIRSQEGEPRKPSLHEAAQRLGVSPNTLRTWASYRRRIPFYRLGMSAANGGGSGSAPSPSEGASPTSPWSGSRPAVSRPACRCWKRSPAPLGFLSETSFKRGDHNQPRRYRGGHTEHGAAGRRG
jgi:hypothetical protein